MVYAEVNIGDSVERGLDTFFSWLPGLIGALVILLIGYIVAKVVGNLLARVLMRAGLDRTMLTGQTGEWVRRVTASPSVLIGKLAFWAIFLVAGAIAAGVSTLASRFMGDTPTGRVVSTVAPILVMTIATFMILDQLKIAPDIVVITYAALVGAIALAAALAFGLGGRDVAAEMLRGAYVKGQRATEQAKRDLETGKQRVETQVSDQDATRSTVIAEHVDTRSDTPSTRI